MIVDAHVAIDSVRFPVEMMLEVLKASRIESAVVFANAQATDLESENRYVLQSASAHGLFPFLYVGGNPWTDSRPDELLIPDEIDQFAGIRWHRWVGEGIDREGLLDRDEVEWAVNLFESPEFEAFAAAAAHYNLPIIVEESLSVTLELVLRFPSLDIIIPHLGARSGGESNVLREFWDKPNVYFNTALAQLDEITLARVGSDRILFGSGFPEGDPEAELAKIDRLPIAEDFKEGMYGENVESLLAGYRGL